MLMMDEGAIIEALALSRVQRGVRYVALVAPSSQKSDPELNEMITCELPGRDSGSGEA